MMKKQLLFILLMAFSLTTYAQVGVGTPLPNASSQLEVVSSDRGVLIPQIALQSSVDVISITNGNVTSLLVYNTSTVANDITPGYHYWDGSKWQRITNSDDVADIVSNLETLTTLVDNGDGTITYTDEDGGTTTIDIGAMVSANETVTTLVNNGDGTFTYTSEDGTVTVINSNSPNIVDNGDGTYTVTNGDGTTSIIDTNAASSMVTDGTIDVDGDGTPDNGITVQDVINNIENIINANETLTVISQDIAAGTITYKDEDGADTVLDIAAMIAGNETLTTYVDNGDGTSTYTDEDGVVNTINNSAIAENVLIEDGTVDVDGDGTPDNGVTLQDVIDNLDDIVAANETVTTLADNTDGTYTYTSEDGTTTGVDTNAASSMVTDGTIDVDGDGTPDNGITVQDVINNIENIIDANETLTVISQDIAAGTITYKDEDGADTVLDIAAMIAGNETLTTYVDNGDGTSTYTDEDGVVNTINNSAIAENVLIEDGTVDIDGDGTPDNGVTLQDVIDNLDDIVAANETVTTLADNTDGTYTYTSEDGTMTGVDTNAASSMVTDGTIDVDGDGTPDNGITVQDVINNIENIIDANETLTVISQDIAAGTITYKDEDGADTVLDIAAMIAGNETLTTYVDNGDGTSTYTDEDGVANTINNSAIAENVLIEDGTVDIDGDGTPDNGVTLQDVIDNLDDIVAANETVTTLADNTDGTYTYTSEDGTTTGVDTNAASSMVTDGTIDIDGDGTPDSGITVQDVINNIENIIDANETLTVISQDIAAGTITYKDEDGADTVLDIAAMIAGNETLTTYVDNGDGTSTYTDEDGVANTINNSAIAENVLIEDGTVDVDGDGTPDNGVTLQDVIDNLDDIVAANETVTTLVDNTDGTFTYTSEDGTVTVIDVNNPSITDNNDGTYTVTNADGTTATIDTTAGSNPLDAPAVINGVAVTTVQEAINALAAQAGVVSTLVNTDGTYTYTDEAGTITSFDVTQTGGGDPNVNLTIGAAGDVYVDENTGDVWTHDGTTWTSQSPAANEPWFGTDDNAGATDNTEDIYSMGKVGIGTSNGSTKLSVNGSIGVTDAPFELPTEKGLFFRYLDNGTTISRAEILSFDYTAGIQKQLSIVGSPLYMSNNTAHSTSADVALVGSNFGIGTITPNEKLEVNGKVRVSDLTGTDAATDVIVTADATTGELKEGGTLAAAVAAVADATDDAWVNNPTDTSIELGTLSDGTTARPAGTEVTVNDNGAIFMGNPNPAFVTGFEKILMQGATGSISGISDLRPWSSTITTARDNSTNGSPTVRFVRSRGTVDAPTPVLGNDRTALLDFRGYSGDATRPTTLSSRIVGLISPTGVSAAGHAPGEIAFETNEGTTWNGVSERMRITSAGNVGIGTTTPTHMLDVAGMVRVQDLTGTDAATDVIVTADATTGELKEGGTLAAAAAASEPWFGVDDNAGATDNTEDIYMMGNVGIGTSTPNTNANLHILESTPNAIGAVRTENDLGFHSWLFTGGSTSLWPNTSVVQAGIRASGDASKMQFETVGTAPGSYFQFKEGGSSNVFMHIDAPTGNVGIGTITPTHMLDVAGMVRVQDLTGTDAATDVIVTADATTGELKEGGTLAAAAAANEPWFGADDNMGATDNTEDIYSMGNVGIGISNPDNKLHIQIDEGLGAGRTIGVLENINTGNGASTTFNIITGTSKTTVDAFGQNYNFIPAISNKSMVRSVDNDGLVLYASDTGKIEFMSEFFDLKMVMENNGNFGIGTATPNEKLEVNGKVRVSDLTGTDAATDVIVTADATTGELKEGGTLAAAVAAVADATNDSWIESGAHTVTTTTGNVGIGTTAPTQKFEVIGKIQTATGQTIGTNYGAHIVGGSNYAELAAFLYGTGPANLALNPTGGNVGIGTTSPASEIHVVDPTGSAFITIESTDNTKAQGITYKQSGAAIWSNFVGAGDEFSIKDEANNTFPFVMETGTPSHTIRLQNTTGNVGIGTTTPTERLHVNGNGLFESNNGNVGFVSITPDFNNESYIQFYTATGVFKDATIDASNLFLTANGNQNIIMTAGQVGIGTMAPTEKLDVVGNIKASGNLQSGTMTYPDYVFEAAEKGMSTLNKNYTFKTLNEVEVFIKTNKHLPGVTGISELEKTDNGYNVNVTAMSVQTLEKVEELFLHTIAQEKKLEALTKENEALKTRLAKIEAALGLDKN